MSGEGGWLNSRIKNVREAQNKLKQKQQTEINENSPENAVSGEPKEISDDEAKAIITSLKSTVIEPGKMREVMQKLALTRKYRKKMLANKELNLKEQFPYLFTDKNLVNII